MRRTLIIFFSLFAIVLAARLCHSGILWVEEAYPTAAALEMLRGKTLYRDIWFDKPPLFPLTYLLWLGKTGWPLRVAGAVFVLISSLCAWWAARRVWRNQEGLIAAALVAFFLTFGVPSAVMALTPDLLMLPLHLVALGFAINGSAARAGVAAGVAFWINPKALLVLAACPAFQWRRAHRLAIAFSAVVLTGALALIATGSAHDFWQQVWQWGRVYSRETPFESPFGEGFRRTLNWAGFHLTLVVGAAAFFVHDLFAGRRRYALWLALSFIGVCLGLRFFPRYYFHLLAPMVFIAARGLALMPRRHAVAVCLLLVVPFARYAPRYVTLASDLAAHRPHNWPDLALEQDSRDAATLVRNSALRSDTLLVWGYRPELFAFTGLPAATRYIDSQPLNGVLADRHLTSAHVSYPELAERNRETLYRGPLPVWIIDGLGPLNPALDVFGDHGLNRYAGLYERIGSTKACVIYRLRAELPQ